MSLMLKRLDSPKPSEADPSLRAPFAFSRDDEARAEIDAAINNLLSDDSFSTFCWWLKREAENDTLTAAESKDDPRFYLGKASFVYNLLDYLEAKRTQKLKIVETQKK